MLLLPVLTLEDTSQLWGCRFFPSEIWEALYPASYLLIQSPGCLRHRDDGIQTHLQESAMG